MPAASQTNPRMAGADRNWYHAMPFSSGFQHSPSADTAAVITLTADAGRRNVIKQIFYSYAGGTPAGGNIKVEDGAGNTVFSQDVAVAGRDQIDFDPPLHGSLSTNLIVTLAAGGGSVVGKVYVNGYKEE